MPPNTKAPPPPVHRLSHASGATIYWRGQLGAPFLSLPATSRIPLGDFWEECAQPNLPSLSIFMEQHRWAIHLFTATTRLYVEQKLMPPIVKALALERIFDALIDSLATGSFHNVIVDIRDRWQETGKLSDRQLKTVLDANRRRLNRLRQRQWQGR